MFQEYLGVECALLQQIVAAVEPKYIKALRNPVTNKIVQSIPTIFDYLFETYGDVTPQELHHLTTQVESMNFPPNEPVDTFFTEIDYLGTITELARAPMSEQQKIKMGYLLIQQTQVYSTAFSKWNQKEYQDQTWETFKSHFRDAQKSLRRTGALTLQESINHTEIVNLVQQGVQQALATTHALVMDITVPAPPTCLPALEEVSAAPSSVSANSVTSDLTMQSIQQNMQIICPQVLKTQTPNEFDKELSYPWHVQSRYHECRTPVEGHKKAATLQKRMGGSEKNIT